MSDDGMDELIGEFLVESFENLDQLDRDLVALEQDPTNRDVLGSIFRTIHTIKGTCGFLGFHKLESITHVGESLLSLLRDGVAMVDADIASGLLTMTDAVREILVQIESSQEEGDGDYTALVDRLTELAARASGEPLAAPAAIEAVVEEAAAEAQKPEPKVVDVGGGFFLDMRNGAPADAAPAETAPAETAPADAAPAPAAPAAPAPVAAAVAAPGPEGEEAHRKESQLADSSVRVDVALLDELMNLVGELVLARNQILQCSAAADADSTFVATSQRLNLITTELQAQVMKTRMQPIGNVWGKFPRVVRDLATQLGKHVRLEMEGKDTELDKSLIETIKDPLTHIVRNSVDHGIETPDVRRERGKPEEGVLLLRAYHEGGQVNIEITDDGAGIDVERVKAKAVESGLVTSDQAARMTDREAVNLIFLPGFSTAEKVTNVSGRGVGMDVVRTNLEKIGGTLEIHNRPGDGTTLLVKIPLTLAIIPALTVTCGGDHYAIPQVSLLELVGLEGEQARDGIEMVHGAPVYRLRGNILPIVYLHEQLAVDSQAAEGRVNIVVLRADDRTFGLVVDHIKDTQEIVVKPLGSQWKGINAFSGCTIMGDGNVALILDVLGLAQKARVVQEQQGQKGTTLDEQVVEAVDETEAMLVLAVGAEGRCAVPLEQVDRLEEFPRNDVEFTGGLEVVKYREQILPLIELSSVLGFRPADLSETTSLQTVIYHYEGRLCGLVVDRIVDIVEEQPVVQRCVDRVGIYGSAVIQGAVTDLLDIEQIIRRADPNFFDRPLYARVPHHAAGGHDGSHDGSHDETAPGAASDRQSAEVTV